MSFGSAQIRSAGKLVLLTLAAALGVTLATGSPATTQDNVASEIHFTADGDAAEIQVVEVLTFPRSYREYALWIPAEASDLSSSVGFTDGESEEFFRRVTLTTRGATTVEVSYTLQSSVERQSGAARVNKSFVGFDIWPREGTNLVSVTVPSGFDDGIDLSLFTRSQSSDGRVLYESTNIESLWGYWFIALSDSALVKREVDVGVDVVEIAGWAGDNEWLDFAEEYVSQGIPILSELTGQPWPEDDLQVVESVAPSREGYGGWYNRRKSQIEVSDGLDANTLLHELSHAWFNGLFYDGRWLIEGFAEEYASAALFEIDGIVTEPTEPGPAPEGFTGLADWRSRLFFEDNWDEEYYGYETSWFVIDSVTDEIGRDGMAKTLQAMSSGRPTYGLEGEPLLFPANDWRRFLDSLELHGDSKLADALFREHVVPPGGAALLDERRTTLELYNEFSGNSNATVPVGIRDSMGRWRFADARTRIARATAMTERIDDLDRRAAVLGASLPRAVAELYLASEADFQQLEIFLKATEESLAAVERTGGFDQEAEIRNFELGRFELMTHRVDDTSSSVRELNLDAESSQSRSFLLVSLFSAAIVVSGVLALNTRLKQGEAAPSAPEPY